MLVFKIYSSEMHEIIRWRLCDNFVNLFDVGSGNTPQVCGTDFLLFILLDAILNFIPLTTQTCLQKCL